MHRSAISRAAWGRTAVHLILAAISVLCLLPLWLIVAASFTDDRALTRNGYGLWPSEWSTTAYSYILSSPAQLLSSYRVTLIVTAAGTLAGLLITAMLAYTLAQPEFRWRKPLAFLVYFTMLFNGGLVPYYLLMTNYLHLKNTILALIVPMLVVPFYVLLLRTYFATQLPRELLDAARVDGAGELRIFFVIALPLARPALATVGLFLVLAYWNDWVNSLYFITKPELYSLQYLLYSILNRASALARNPYLPIAVPLQPVRMAMVVLATGPAALAFLWVQKYLVRGLTIGALK